jgi:pyruvate ferredoxin oxidoreductase alpha subunit
MQLVGVLYGEGYVKEYYRGEEEVGVMAAIAGGSRAGVRCYTATAGPGTLRGLEGIASWPGHRLPVVAMFTCRVVNAPLAIQPDNIEVSYLLNCGMIVFHAENQQDMFDFTLAGFTISEKNDVTLPVGVCCDGFFVTHARGYVRMQDRGIKLPPREAWRGAVPVLDAENPPARLSRDAPVQKSNFMAYNIHAVWQQEVWAAVERSRKYIDRYMGGLLTAENVDDAEVIIIASGSAAAQSREAVRLCKEKGMKVGLIKVRSLPDQGTPSVVRQGQADRGPGIQLRRVVGEGGGDCHLRFLQCENHRWPARVRWSIDAGGVDRGRSRIRCEW